MNNLEMNQAIKDRTKFFFDKAIEIWGSRVDRLANQPPVIYLDLKGLVAGKAWYKEWCIQYNTTLAYTDIETFLERTVPHEVAHMIDYLLGYRSHHGEPWKRIMRMLGASDTSRCHKYDMSEAIKDTNRSVFHCNCSNHFLTPRKASDYKILTCRICNGSLNPGWRES